MRAFGAGCCIVVALSASSCGDDNSERLTQEEYLAEANAICANANEELQVLADDALASDDRAAVVAFVRDTALPNLRGQVDDVRALNGPEELQADVEEILDDADTVLDAVEEQGEGLESDEALAGVGDAFDDVNPRLQALGLADCAT